MAFVKIEATTPEARLMTKWKIEDEWKEEKEEKALSSDEGKTPK